MPSKKVFIHQKDLLPSIFLSSCNQQGQQNINLKWIKPTGEDYLTCCIVYYGKTMHKGFSEFLLYRSKLTQHNLAEDLLLSHKSWVLVKLPLSSKVATSTVLLLHSIIIISTSSAFTSCTLGGGLLTVGALLNKLSSSSMPNPNKSLLALLIGLVTSVD